jgi:hypothetical protein
MCVICLSFLLSVSGACASKATYWVVTDMGTAEGQSLVFSALKFLAGKHSTHARVALIHCNDGNTSFAPNLARLVRAATELGASEDPELYTKFFLELLQEGGAEARQVTSPPSLIPLCAVFHDCSYLCALFSTYNIRMPIPSADDGIGGDWGGFFPTRA